MNSAVSTCNSVSDIIKGRIIYDIIILNPTLTVAGILFLENIGAIKNIPIILEKIRINKSIDFVTRVNKSVNIIFLNHINIFNL